MALVKYNNNSLSSVTSSSNFPAGAMTLIKTLTASSSSTLSFVDGSSDVVLDSTYPIYVFKFINIHAQTLDSEFTFNLSADSGSNYNVTKTTTFFRSSHNENGSGAELVYVGSHDLAQSTSFQKIAQGISADNDHSVVGTLHLFNPSSTTFVKHFLANVNSIAHSDGTNNQYIAGYFNSTSAIDAINFKFSSGTIDSGNIKLYGLKDS